jgi:hypothetical protein
MHTNLLRSTFLPAFVAALAFAPQHVRAQSGPIVGLGAGVSGVAETGNAASRAGVAFHLRAGWQASRMVSVMLESNLDGMGGVHFSSDPLIDPSSSRQLGTVSLLASVQLGNRSSVYVRPGIGIARHTFSFLESRMSPGGNSDLILLESSNEWGPAAGLTVGHEMRVIPGFPLNIEAVAHWSGGEDSTGERWIGGLQIVRELRF